MPGTGAHRQALTPETEMSASVEWMTGVSASGRPAWGKSSNAQSCSATEQKVTTLWCNPFSDRLKRAIMSVAERFTGKSGRARLNAGHDL